MKYLFPLTWHVHESEIQIFGWCRDKEDKEEPRNCCVRVYDFKPYMYLELENLAWNAEKLGLVKSALMRLRAFGITDLQERKQRGLYANPRLPPAWYIRVECSDEDKRRRLRNFVKNGIRVSSIGQIRVKVYEENVSSVLQLVCTRGISTSDWFMFETLGPLDAGERLSSYELEYSVSSGQIHPVAEGAPKFRPPRPLIMGYDIETYSHDPSKFCKASHPEDKIFQISLVFGLSQSPAASWKKYILTLGNPLMPEGSVIEVRRFNHERDLLLAYTELVVQHEPHILVGYNTFGFDNEYMIDRAKGLDIYDEFIRQGCTCEKPELVNKEWSSSAYGKQKIYFLDLKGRVHIDMLILVRREYKFHNYKLATVAQHFLGHGKDPLTPYDIFNFYKAGMDVAPEPSRELGLVAHYCVVDGQLPFEMFEKIQYWFALTAMAAICYVTITDLFKQGQQKKVFSQVYKYSYDNDIVVQNNSVQGDEDLYVQGAHVLSPTPGIYKNAVSFDFASLYPSIIISHNIDYSTLVREDDPIPDEECHVIEWEEHFGCDCECALPARKVKGRKFVVCKSYRFRWLREPRGVLPNIVLNLLQARKSVKARLKQLKPGTVDYDIADKLQNSFKISANSAYGGIASKMGALIFTQGGMCVTAVGRRSINRVKEIFEKKYSALVIYGDTDSAYVILRDVPLEQLHAVCEKLSIEVSQHFPQPMKLEFEGKVYRIFFLLTKKRYLYTLSGDMSDLDYKGVLLKRRDSSRIVQGIYRRLLLMMMNFQPSEEIEAVLYEEMARLCAGAASIDDYIVTSSLQDIDHMNRDIKNDKKMLYGSYTVSRLSEDEKKRKAQYKRVGAANDDDYYLKCLPGHVQVALRMRERGQTIQSGARLSMIVMKRGGPSAKLFQKLEEVDYFNLFFHRRDIDTVHYLSLLVTALRELFQAYTSRDYEPYFTTLLNSARAKQAVIDQLRGSLTPVLFIEPARSPAGAGTLHAYFK